MVARSRRLPGFLLVLGFAALARAELVTETPLVSRVLANGFEVIVYPDSNKVMVRPLGRDEIYDLAGKRGYWDGEVADAKK